jgi:glycine cleavage system H protein
MWVADAGEGRVRVGMDALGIETSGTLVQLSLPSPRAAVTAGRPFGQMEAAKFVGPLISPVTGIVSGVNEKAAADPGLAERDPYGAGWLIEVEVSAAGTALREAEGALDSEARAAHPPGRHNPVVHGAG